MIRSPRLTSLDAFRGATVVAMLLVNNPGSGKDAYPPLLHAPWHGWTFTDLIFPSFLWIVGVAMTLSFARRVESGNDRGELFRHVMRRSAIIFALGMLLSAFPFGLLPAHHFSLEKLRIPGVLQRIAVCYLIASAICLRTGPKGQLMWAVGLVTGYTLMLSYIPVPGYGAGQLDQAKGTLAWWVDSYLLAGHTWSGAPARGFDPEGILSTLPAIATTLCGALVGQVLRGVGSEQVKTLRLLGGGLGMLALGLVWNRWIPINKNLWTGAFVVFMAGWSTVLLAVFYWLIDVRGWRRWAAPFVVVGMNAIAVYVLAGLLARLLGLIKWTAADGTEVTLKTYIYRGVFTPLASPVNASLLFALAFVLVHVAVAWVMWRKKWFVKV